MGRRKLMLHSGRRVRGRSLTGSKRYKHLPLRLEQFEPRLPMDAAGFVHTSPDPDPDTVIGVATIEALDDHYKFSENTSEVRLDVLQNDVLPEGSQGLSIRSVSETRLGATVSISEDGQRIIYSPGDSFSFDTFYYIVEDESGSLGKANVNIGPEVTRHFISNYRSNDYFTVVEDGPEKTLNVLQNDVVAPGAEIVELTTITNLGSSIRIADDGRSLVHQPAPGTSGRESYEYTVDDGSGTTVTHRVSISISKPIRTQSDYYELDAQPGPIVLDVMSNDRQWSNGWYISNDWHLINGWLKTPTPETPRIVEVSAHPYAGTFAISEDGQSVLFDPNDDFNGSLNFTYTVRYGPEDYQTTDARVSVQVTNSFLAVDNWFAIDPGSQGNLLDVLANDPKLTRNDVGRTIVEISGASEGGSLTIEDGRTIRYTPAAGFTGEETFTYTVEDEYGQRDSATVTLYVAERVVDPTGVPTFVLPGELRQFLIDQSVERYAHQFGTTQRNYQHYGDDVFFLRSGSLDVVAFGGPETTFSLAAIQDASQTNTQEQGVDEADIVETDGRYLYTFSDGELIIADLVDPAAPVLVSRMSFDDQYTEMYLQGDRLTLIDRGGYRGGYRLAMQSSYYYDRSNSGAVVTVLDISDPSAVSVLKRTEIDGRIVDSRAVGDQVYLTVSGLNLPELEYTEVPGAEGSKGYDLRVYETLDEYVARVSETLIETAVPTYRTFDGEGNLVDSGLLTDPAQIHKPVDDADNSLLTLVTFDVGGDVPGLVASAGIFTSSSSEVYMSGDSFYVIRSGYQQTTIFKFSLDDEGAPTLVATGKVDGYLLNQFSVDEHDGRFRIATTQVVNETHINDWGVEIIRQQRRFNNLFVLEQNGNTLEIVGSVENLAPTETIKSVRFMDEVAYIVTFRVIDPLFVIDLSDPINPTVQGSLKIPGYSDYLQPVGEDYVIGIGRDADEITGRIGGIQISLFYVGDMANPTLVDQVTMEDVQWASSEALWDHHAVSYFSDSGILTLPVSWWEPIDVAADGWNGSTQQSAMWTFQIDVDQSGGGSIDVMGSVEHDGRVRRSVRIGDSLVTISEDFVKINNLFDVSEQFAVLDLDSEISQPATTADDDPEIAAIPVQATLVADTSPLSGWDAMVVNESSRVSPSLATEVLSSADKLPAAGAVSDTLESAFAALTEFELGEREAAGSDPDLFDEITPSTDDEFSTITVDAALEVWGEELDSVEMPL